MSNPLVRNEGSLVKISFEGSGRCRTERESFDTPQMKGSAWVQETYSSIRGGVKIYDKETKSTFKRDFNYPKDL